MKEDPKLLTINVFIEIKDVHLNGEIMPSKVGRVPRFTMAFCGLRWLI